MNWLRVSLWCGSLICFIVWLTSLIVYISLPSGECERFTSEAPPPSDVTNPTNGNGTGSDSGVDIANTAFHILPLPLFCGLSLFFTGIFFLLFFLQLFQHDRLSHEVMLEDLAESAVTAPSTSRLAQCCSSFTHTLLLVANTSLFIIQLLLCIFGIGSIEWGVRDGQTDSCKKYRDIGIDLLVLDFALTVSFFILTCYRCIQRCSNEDHSGIDLAANIAKVVRSAKRGRHRNNVKYSAVDRQTGSHQHDGDLDDGLSGEDEMLGIGDHDNDSELFSVDALRAGGQQSHEELELMDMIDAHKQPAKPTIASGGTQPSPIQSVPTLDPPRVDESKVSITDASNDFEETEDYEYEDILVEDGDDDDEMELDEKSKV